MFVWSLFKLSRNRIFFALLIITFLISALTILEWIEFIVNSPFTGNKVNFMNIIPFWTPVFLNRGDENIDLTSNSTIKSFLGTFWKNKVSKIPNDSKIYLLLKIKYDDNSVRTVSKMIKADVTDFQQVYEYLSARMSLILNEYSDGELSNLVLMYHFFTEEGSNKEITSYFGEEDKKLEVSSSNSILGSETIGSYGIPITTDITKWGSIISNKNNVITIKKPSSTLKYEIQTSDEVHIVKVMINNSILLQFQDYLGVNFTTFNRITSNNLYIYENGRRVFYKSEKSLQFISTLKPVNKEYNKYITIDIETRTINGEFLPYCISLFDGKVAWSYYLTDFDSINDMLKTAIKSIMRNKYNNYSVFAHNFSGFDGIFLLRIISELGSVSPIMKDGKMISIPLKFMINDKKEGTITFKDSYLILKDSLRKLAKSFNVEEKSYFPYKFVNNPNIDLNYIGSIPKFELWDNISQDQFDLLKKENWSLKNETIKYCEQDCITLHQILVKFNHLIFTKWNVNINKFPTLPSLTFAIFRTQYMEDNTIPKITGQAKKDIGKSYTGGHTDVYIPHGKDLNQYDVNSLYPTIMEGYDMPVGPMHYFEGNILNYDPQAFGHFYCKIKTVMVDENGNNDINGKPMERPLIQTKVKTNFGLRTIAPLGEWNDWLFSEEIHQYSKLGYEFEIIKGYTFGRKNLFKEYINELYKIKEELAEKGDKSNPMYHISKLLMNSLYGRFGMSTELPTHEIVSEKDFINMSKDQNFDSVTELGNGFLIISFIPKQGAMEELKNDYDNLPNVNIAIASCITSYARVFMAPYLANPKNVIYYMDTDCLVMKSELKTDNFLGGWKLEQFFTEAFFLGAKLYAGILESGKSFSKVKGFTRKIAIGDFESLLYKNTVINLEHEKRKKNLAGSLHINPTSYGVRATDSKREYIYDSTGKFVNTKPYWINEFREIVPNTDKK